MHSGEISICFSSSFHFWQCSSGNFCASTGLLEPEGPELKDLAVRVIIAPMVPILRLQLMVCLAICAGRPCEFSSSPP
jgi:hypothetical protein